MKIAPFRLRALVTYYVTNPPRGVVKSVTDYVALASFRLWALVTDYVTNLPRGVVESVTDYVT